MFNLSRMRRHPRQFGRVVGLSVEQFATLLLAVEAEYIPEHRARLGQRPSGQARQRAVGGGRRFALSLEERLLCTLLYYRLHLSSLLLGCLFDLDESNVWREREQRMAPLLRAVLPLPMQDHLLSSVEETHKGAGQGAGRSKGRKRIGTLQELLEAYPDLRDICVDATEQQIPVPRDKREKKQWYSGKSHCHAIKTQVTTAKRLILHAFGGCSGNLADRSVCRASGVLRAISQAASPKKAKVRAGKRPACPTWKSRHRRRVRLDRGYSGFDQAYAHLPGVEVLAALKGTSRTRVTALGRAWNAAMVSKKRMQIEQNIGHLQTFGVLKGVYRARRENHFDTFCLVAGLHNFKILGRLTWEK